MDENQNLQNIKNWIKKYEYNMARGQYDDLTKYRKLEWEANYMLAITHLERSQNHGA